MEIKGPGKSEETLILEMEVPISLYVQLAGGALLAGISNEEALERAIVQFTAGVRRDLADVISGLGQPSFRATATFNPPRFLSWHWPIKATQRINLKRFREGPEDPRTEEQKRAFIQEDGIAWHINDKGQIVAGPRLGGPSMLMDGRAWGRRLVHSYPNRAGHRTWHYRGRRWWLKASRGQFPIRGSLNGPDDDRWKAGIVYLWWLRASWWRAT